MQGGVDVWADVGNGVVKSLVFGFAVTFVALLPGLRRPGPTPEGVSRATTRTVVMASLAVLGLDFVLTAHDVRAFDPRRKDAICKAQKSTSG